MTDCYTDNNGVRLHPIALDRIALDGPDDRIPLIIIPGMIEDAMHYANRLHNKLPHPSVAISFRSRGRSSAPSHGYSFTDQLSDVAAIIDHHQLARVILVGFSIGVAFSLAYARQHPKRVAGVVLIDYPPHYPVFPAAWVDDVTASNALPVHAVRQLAAESDRVLLDPRDVTAPALVIRAASGLLPEELEYLYTARMPTCSLVVLPTGHDVLEPAPDLFLATLTPWLSQLSEEVSRGSFPGP